MVIKNHSPINRLYTDVFFVVFDDKGNERISTKMYGFKAYDELQIGTFDMDFSLRVPGSTELEGIGNFNLTTSQVALLGVDEFGCSDIKYTFKLYFRDSGKDTEFMFDDCIVVAKEGLIFRKVRKSS